jgi:hypothetical protein
MAVSPLIVPPGSERATAATKSKLSTTQVPSNGAIPEPAHAINGAGPDLAEQMNEDEKHKYVKGAPSPSNSDPIQLTSMQERNSVKVPMRTST